MNSLSKRVMAKLSTMQYGVYADDRLMAMFVRIEDADKFASYLSNNNTVECEYIEVCQLPYYRCTNDK